MPKMIMIPCDSDAVHSIGYDPESETLAVCFQSGGVYHYDGVPKSKFDAFQSAPSKGVHFYRHIKPYHEGVKQ